jgi:hypothetical protein
MTNITLGVRFPRRTLGIAACIASVACASAQIIDLHGKVRVVIDEVPGFIQVNEGDAVTVSFTLHKPHTTEGTALALFSDVPLSLKLGSNETISVLDANARMEVGYSAPGGSDSVWGVSAFGNWKPNTRNGEDVRIYTALHSLADIGNTLNSFPNNVPLESFDLHNGGSANFRLSGAQIVWSYDSYTVRPNLAAAPEPETYGWMAMGLLIVAWGARKVRGRHSES